MIFNITSFSSAGGKAQNEDTARIHRDSQKLAAIVADGLGAHGGGDIASQAAAAAISDALPAMGAALPNALSACFQAANRAVLERQVPGLMMKTTAVLLVIEGNNAVFAHVGDSRGYFFRDGSVAVQTTDHSASQLAVLRGTITPQEVRFHESRNQLFRALGARNSPRRILCPCPAFKSIPRFIRAAGIPAGFRARPCPPRPRSETRRRSRLKA